MYGRETCSPPTAACAGCSEEAHVDEQPLPICELPRDGPLRRLGQLAWRCRRGAVGGPGREQSPRLRAGPLRAERLARAVFRRALFSRLFPVAAGRLRVGAFEQRGGARF